MNNYPPGVTGNEDIFGPRRSFVATRDCGYIRTTSRQNAIGAWEDVESNPCDFSGEVDIDEYSESLIWCCPKCDYEHEELLPEPGE